MGSIRPAAPGAQRTIGVLSPVVGGFYFGALIAGISRAARNAGHRVVAVQTYPAGLDRARYPDEPLLEVPVALGAVDGIIVLAKAVRHDRLASVQDWGRPVVLVSEDETTVPAPVVTPDNAGGMATAVLHLLDHGHTRIGFLGNPEQRDIRERHEAYRSTLAAHGIEPEPAWFFRTVDNHEQGGADAATRLLAAGVPTTAMLAATDRNAIGFLRTLRTGGLVLPRDQAIIGFDHTEIGARLTPRLSTVDPHNDRVGGLAVQLLLDRLRGEDVAPGAHRAPATLVTRESCGCGESTAIAETSDPDRSLQAYGSTPARARLRRLSGTGFGGSSPTAGAAGPGGEARTRWLRAVVDLVTSAADHGTVAPGTAFGRLADLTAALQPHPEALEQFVSAVRDLEGELIDGLPAVPDGPAALRRATTEVLLALTKGCTRPMLARSGYLERTIADQYEVDMDLLRGKGASPRALTWLPEAVRGPACLGLWAGAEGAPGDREMEIVGVNDRSGTLSRLVGLRLPASQFPPPPALAEAATTGRSELTFVIPVTSGGSDWGLLAIGGTVDTRMTSARDKYNHWAALLAVALDQERLLASLRDQRRELEQAAARERALADAVRASEERYALASLAAQDGTWDWDVSAGTVYYSPRWKQTLGYAEDEIGSAPTEWLERVHPDDRDAVSASIAAQLGGARTPLELEHRVRTSSGAYRWMLCRAVTVLDDAGCPARLVGALVDMTDRKEQELALRHHVLLDPETGLVNRMLFLDRLRAAVSRTRRAADYDCAVVLLRLVTEPGRDTTETEQAVRREVVRRLRAALREGDSAARLRQGEFAVLLDDVGAGDPPRVGEFQAAVVADLGPRVAVAALTGIRRFQDADEVLREADIALLRAQTQVAPRGRSPLA